MVSEPDQAHSHPVVVKTKYGLLLAGKTIMSGEK